MNEYNGKERRMNDMDHDLLQQIANDVKHMVKNFDSHVEQNINQFYKHDYRISVLEKSQWKLVGGLTVLIAIVQVAVRFIFK